MNLKTILLAAASVAAMLTAIPASAAPLLFTLTGSRTATFTYDPVTTSPTFLGDSRLIGQQVSYNVLPGSFGGVSGNAFVGFGNGLVAALNIQSPNLGFTQFTGPRLFTLVNNRPVFNLGTFALSGLVSGRSSLTIALAPTAAVPEPATWAMMILGVGMAGGAMRYRRRKTAVSFA